MRLYIYNMNGEQLRKIGNGNFDITTFYGFDETTGDVYYQAAALNAHDRQIYVTHKTERRNVSHKKKVLTMLSSPPTISIL